jgi:SAM-dependent methyltransferase
MIRPEFWDARHRGATERRILPSPALRGLDFELDRTFRRHGAGLKGRKLLEVGCGGSLWLPYFRRELGLRIEGLDYSGPGLAAARAILDRHGLRAKLHHRDLWDRDPEMDLAYDIVFSLGFVEHLDDPASGIVEMARFLAPGGLIVTWTPNIKGRIVRWGRRLGGNPADFYRDLDLGSLSAIHRKAGLEIVEARPVQLLDFAMLPLGRFPARLRPWIGRLLRAVSLPTLFAVRFGPLKPSRPDWCAGLIVAARKPF